MCYGEMILIANTKLVLESLLHCGMVFVKKIIISCFTHVTFFYHYNTYLDCVAQTSIEFKSQ